MKCPLIDDWTKKIWYIHTREYYSALRKDDMLPFATTWIHLENMMLSEINQMEKVKNHMISLMWNIKLKATSEQNKRTKFLDTDNSMVVNRGKGDTKG